MKLSHIFVTTYPALQYVIKWAKVQGFTDIRANATAEDLRYEWKRIQADHDCYVEGDWGYIKKEKIFIITTIANEPEFNYTSVERQEWPGMAALKVIDSKGLTQGNDAHNRRVVAARDILHAIGSCRVSGTIHCDIRSMTADKINRLIDLVIDEDNVIGQCTGNDVARFLNRNLYGSEESRAKYYEEHLGYAKRDGDQSRINTIVDRLTTMLQNEADQFAKDNPNMMPYQIQYTNAVFRAIPEEPRFFYDDVEILGATYSVASQVLESLY